MRSTVRTHPLSSRCHLQRAQLNLAQAVSRQAVTIGGTTAGPRDRRAIIFGPEWLAASCLLLPDLHDFISQNLETKTILASIPHRDVMVVFDGQDPAYVEEVRAFIEETEADGRKPLTAELFVVEADGVRPLP